VTRMWRCPILMLLVIAIAQYTHSNTHNGAVRYKPTRNALSTLRFRGGGRRLDAAADIARPMTMKSHADVLSRKQYGKNHHHPSSLYLPSKNAQRFCEYLSTYAWP